MTVLNPVTIIGFGSVDNVPDADAFGSLQSILYNASGNAAAYGSGVVAANVLRVAIATDQLDSVAHDAVDSGTPPKIGAVAIAGLSTATLVSAADRTNVYADIDGALIVHPHCGLEDIVSGTASNTDGASTQCIAAQSAGIKTYLMSVILSNTASTAIEVVIKDGTTAKFTLPVPANTSGVVYNPPLPWPGSAATAWNFDPASAQTTITCSMIGFKSKV